MKERHHELWLARNRPSNFELTAKLYGRVDRKHEAPLMQLPIEPPVKPMLAKRVDTLPKGDTWLYEPKWDGFRALVFRDGDDGSSKAAIRNRSSATFRSSKSPCYPSCLRAPSSTASSSSPPITDWTSKRCKCACTRPHRACKCSLRKARPLSCSGTSSAKATRICARSPSRRVAHGSKKCSRTPRPPLYLTPATRERAVAADWFERFEGAGLDGVMAKPRDGIYEPGKRAMLKVKHKRTVDVVLAGFRWHKHGAGTALGSMLLGLFGDEGILQHVGVAASFTAKRRAELALELAPLREGALDAHPWESWASHQRVPGMKSRWSADKTFEWEPLRPERVLEVSFDHLQGQRFRHTAHFVRWRPDNRPAIAPTSRSTSPHPTSSSAFSPERIKCADILSRALRHARYEPERIFSASQGS